MIPTVQKAIKRMKDKQKKVDNKQKKYGWLTEEDEAGLTLIKILPLSYFVIFCNFYNCSFGCECHLRHSSFVVHTFWLLVRFNFAQLACGMQLEPLGFVLKMYRTGFLYSGSLHNGFLTYCCAIYILCRQGKSATFMRHDECGHFQSLL